MNTRLFRFLPVVLATPAILLTACTALPPSFLASPATQPLVYALGPRDGYTSPLNSELTAACQALVFRGEELQLTAAHERAIHTLFQELEKIPNVRLLIAGYAPPDLPQDHARSTSERRAQATRQRLIELGLEPANIQTVGFGNDFSLSGPSSSVVVIYRQ